MEVTVENYFTTYSSQIAKLSESKTVSISGTAAGKVATLNRTSSLE